MKIERINDNQIRCTLSNFDLSIRNLNIKELAYGSDKAKNLFREMIQRASKEFGFEADDIPLMVEAIPMSNESIILIITRIDDPEELDTRFSRFTPLSEEEEASWMGVGDDPELLDGADALLELLGNPDFLSGLDFKEAIEKTIKKVEDGESAEPESNDPSQHIKIYQFSSLDLVCAAAKEISGSFSGSSTLYKNPVSGRFYLILRKEASDAIAFSRTCNMLSEYGTRQKYDSALEAYYAEHYELFIEKDALNVLAKL